VPYEWSGGALPVAFPRLDERQFTAVWMALRHGLQCKLDEEREPGVVPDAVAIAIDKGSATIATVIPATRSRRRRSRS
jgi:hypothetical protein